MNEPLITVATFDNVVEAEIASGRLEAEGINTVLADVEAVSWAWHLGQAVGGIKVQVREDDVQRAFAVLGEVRAELQPKADTKQIESDEALANRACRAAMLGFMLFPLQIYSILLLIKLLSRERSGNLSPRARKRAAWALILDMWWILCVVLAWIAISSE